MFAKKKGLLSARSSTDDNRPYRSLNEKSPQRFNLRLGDYALIDHVSYN
jgi:hypothetical protein